MKFALTTQSPPLIMCFLTAQFAKTPSAIVELYNPWRKFHHQDVRRNVTRCGREIWSNGVDANGSADRRPSCSERLPRFCGTSWRESGCDQPDLWAAGRIPFRPATSAQTFNVMQNKVEHAAERTARDFPPQSADFRRYHRSE